jgi:hypothetical protein
MKIDRDKTDGQLTNSWLWMGGYKFLKSRGSRLEGRRVKRQDHASFFTIGQGATKTNNHYMLEAVQSSVTGFIGQDGVYVSSLFPCASGVARKIAAERGMGMAQVDRRESGGGAECTESLSPLR